MLLHENMQDKALCFSDAPFGGICLLPDGLPAASISPPQHSAQLRGVFWNLTIKASPQVRIPVSG